MEKIVMPLHDYLYGLSLSKSLNVAYASANAIRKGFSKCNYCALFPDEEIGMTNTHHPDYDPNKCTCRAQFFKFHNLGQRIHTRIEKFFDKYPELKLAQTGPDYEWDGSRLFDALTNHSTPTFSNGLTWNFEYIQKFKQLTYQFKSYYEKELYQQTESSSQGDVPASMLQLRWETA